MSEPGLVSHRMKLPRVWLYSARYNNPPRPPLVIINAESQRISHRVEGRSLQVEYQIHHRLPTSFLKRRINLAELFDEVNYSLVTPS
jgi:hypothetical protein